VSGYVSDLAALREDYDFEEAVTRRYGHMAAEAEDAATAALFTELARGEAGHRRGLRRMLQNLEDPAAPVVLLCPLCGWEIDFGAGAAEGAVAKCPMCPGRFALRLDEAGDWALERRAP
jgi:rubrerythrin